MAIGLSYCPQGHTVVFVLVGGELCCSYCYKRIAVSSKSIVRDSKNIIWEKVGETWERFFHENTN